MIQGIIASDNSFPGLGYALSPRANGKLALPVAPEFLIYSHFKHVSGVPAPEGSRGVTISKLNILDILIEQMNQVKQTINPIDSAQFTEERLDAMIDAFKTQILQAREARTSMPYTPAPMAQIGVVFDLMI